MKYIIMCGGVFKDLEIPRQLMNINGEPLVERTIRLLRKLGVTDISISTSEGRNDFDYLSMTENIPIIKFHNSYNVRAYNDFDGYWCDGFYYTDEPVCYLCGDVYYSKEALKQIVETPVDGFGFFGVDRPFPNGYYKCSEEPLAFKVVDQSILHNGCKKFRELQDLGPEKWPFRRRPISWELVQIIDGVDLRTFIKSKSFIGVHHFAIDIDEPEDAQRVESVVKEFNID